MAWTRERYLVHPTLDPLQPTICEGSGGSPNAAEKQPKGSIAIQRDGATADLLAYINTDGSTAWSVLAKPLSLAWYTGAITNPAADSAAGVHAANGSDVQTWPGPFTSPVVPRNISITFGALWDGGDVTITGTNQFDAAITEVIADVAGSKVEGVKTFKTVTAITHQLAGAGGGITATAGWGHKFGIAKTLAAAIGALACDSVTEAAAWDATYNAFIPTTLPDGAHDYTWAVPT